MKTVFKILRMILDVFLVAAALLIFMVNGIAKKRVSENLLKLRLSISQRSLMAFIRGIMIQLW